MSTPIATEEAKSLLDQAREALIEWDLQFHIRCGGYPSEWSYAPGLLIQASVMNDEPQLRIYRNATVIKAYKQALKDVKEGLLEDLDEAVGENWPQERWQEDRLPEED